MQHRMMKEAQRAMIPWMGGQPLYAPMSHATSQMNPLLYSGTQTSFDALMTATVSWTSCFISSLCRSLHFLFPIFFHRPGSASGKSIPLKSMPLPPPQSSAYSMPPPSANGNLAPANTNHMLDYLESQVRGMDMTSPLLQVCPASVLSVCVLASYYLFFLMLIVRIYPWTAFFSIRHPHLYQTTCSRSHLLTSTCLLSSHLPPVLPAWSLPLMMAPQSVALLSLFRQ